MTQHTIPVVVFGFAQDLIRDSPEPKQNCIGLPYLLVVHAYMYYCIGMFYE